VASRAPRLFVQQHPAQLLFNSAYGKDGVTRPRLVWIHCPDINGEPARKAEMLTELCAEEKDLVIIGGGVAGYVAAIKAGQEGLKVRKIRPINSATTTQNTV
jgi:protein-L-isoaspartate O-methyltransferase